MVNIGDTCMVTGFFGSQLWVAMRQEVDGRWRLTGKRIDGRGRARFTSRTVGLGDIQVIVPAPNFTRGDEIERKGGLRHVVLSDNGDFVELATPEDDHVPLRRGYVVRVKAGNTTVVSKADLVVECMR